MLEGLNVKKIQFHVNVSFGHSLIYWKTKIQLNNSVCPDHLHRLSILLQVLLYLLKKLADIQCTKLSVLNCDNQSARHIIANTTKHFEIVTLQGIVKLFTVTFKY